MFEARLNALLDRYVARFELTRAELATFRLIILCHSPQSAADELGITVNTLNKHSATAARKLGYSTLLEAAHHTALELAGAPSAILRRTRSGTMRRP